MSTSESAVDQLLALAKVRFGDDFDSGDTGVDTEFFTAMAKGTVADYSDLQGGKDANDPAKAKDWGPERVLKADRIEWLCIDKESATLVSRKGIRIRGARIDGALDLSKVRFDHSILLENCAFAQWPNFSDASFISLYLPGTHCPGIQLHRLRLEGGLHLRGGFVANGEVDLGSASIGQLDCIGGSFLNRGGTALGASAITVTKSVLLRGGFRSEGVVDLRGASIGGQLGCSDGSFLNKGGTAIQANAIKVMADVFLSDDFRAEGEVNIGGATIGGQLSCIGGSFLNDGGTALNANGITVTEDVFLYDGFRAEGEVKLIGAFIGGQLACKGGSFLNKCGTALCANAITVKGDVFLRDGFRAEGMIDFVRAEIQGGLQYRNVDQPEKAALDLRHANVGVLWDDPNSWPVAGNLLLRGFEYKTLDDHATHDPKERVDWLRRDGGDGFSPQPYEQLAKVLSRSGHRGEARTIRIEKERRLAEQVPDGDPDRWWTRVFKRRWWWKRLFGPLTGYGYLPSKVAWYCIGIILIGWPLYEVGYVWEWVTPTRVESEVAPYSDGGAVYPTFQGLAYSLDAFVPLVNIEQVDYWLPNAARGPRKDLVGRYYVSCSGVLLFFYYCQVASGWVLTTLLVVGLTRLVQRED